MKLCIALVLAFLITLINSKPTPTTGSSSINKYLPYAAAIGAAGAALTTAVSIYYSFANPTFETVNDIPITMIKSHSEISGEVMKILDGDTYRIRHLPKKGLFGKDDSKFNGPISSHTLVVRIAAVDTPETAKFGKTGQLYAEEAKTFATTRLMSKK
eukprot:gene15674-21200_t